MNQPLSNNQAVAQRIEGRLQTDTIGTMNLSTSVGGLSFGNMLEVMEFAKMMAISDIAVPDHLRNNPGACLAVTMQAFEWEFSPFAVANKSYAVNKRMAYESQLIQAVILKRAPIKGRFVPTYLGEGGERQCRITVTTLDGQELDYLSPKVKDIAVKNSPLWKSDVDQQLFYFSGRALCRRHFPDVILGVYSREEMAASEPIKDVTPKASGLAARLAGNSDTGFSQEGVVEALNATAAASAQQRDEAAGADVAETTDAASAPSAADIDWTDAAQATDAIKGGVLPEGYSRSENGGLVIPDEVPDGGSRGHSVIMGLFREVTTASGKVVKTTKADNPAQDEQPDPVVIRDAGSAALSGQEREPPEDLSPAQRQFWLVEFDRATADAEAHA